MEKKYEHCNKLRNIYSLKIIDEWYFTAKGRNKN